jgi:SAM-dependent methyltransferase
VNRVSVGPATVQFVRRPYQFLRRRIVSEMVNAAKLRAAKMRLLSSNILSHAEKRLVDRVSCRVHADDFLYAISTPDQYLVAGVSAVRCIDRILAESKHNVGRILDFACGYGRVSRFIKARFPAAEIIVSDINEEALEFCRRCFSVRAVRSSPNFERIPNCGSFDLIWCGSLITHIDANAAACLLRFFYNQLLPGGVCIFTTHGIHAAKFMHTYGLTDSAQTEVLKKFHATGYGYADYPEQTGVGISVVSPERMTTIANTAGQWNRRAFLEHAWDGLQDVYGFRR